MAHKDDTQADDGEGKLGYKVMAMDVAVLAELEPRLPDPHPVVLEEQLGADVAEIHGTGHRLTA